MKRLMLVWVMVLCIVLSCSAAQAVDWDRYAVPSESGISPYYRLSNGDEVSYHYEEDQTLRWYRDGDELNRLTQEDCPHLNTRARIALRSDGNLGVLLKDPEGGMKGSSYYGYGVWSVEGFRLIREWYSYDGYAIMGNVGFLIGSPSGEATLYDLDAQELWQGNLGEGDLSRPYNLFMISANDWIVGLVGWSQSFTYACCRYIDGHRAWMRKTIGYPTYLALDNGSTIMVEYRTDGKNGPTYLSLIDSQGHVTASRQVTADRLSITCIKPRLDDEGHVIIFGTGIGNRRHIYLAWRLCLDQQMNYISLDVRNCRYHNCYSPGYSFDEFGNAWIRLSDYDFDDDKAPDVLVPFEEFPVATSHTILYEWGSPSTDATYDRDSK